MTDITELAQSLKVAAEKATPGQWVAFTHADSQTFSVHTPDDKRCGDVIKWAGFDGQRKAKANAEFIALANPVNVKQLVEALEKAQHTTTEMENRIRKQNRHVCELFDDNTALRQRISELETNSSIYESAASKHLERAEAAERESDTWRTSFDNERFRADKLKAHIDDIEPIRAAAEKLVRCKGRYHSEQNYRALAALFGVTTPDLPPVEAQPAQPCEHSMFWDASGVKRCSKCDLPEHANVHYADAAEMEIAALRQRIAELEREHENLRPVGVMSEKAFRRLENSESRFIALWPRPSIFLPRKRPEDGVIVYARIAAAADKVEAE